ncbi:MAG: TRAP transporter large permease [Pseudomonadota bacterium]
MEWYETLSIGLALLFGLFLTGMPIFLAFAAMIVLGVLMMMGPAGFSLVVNSLFTSGSSLTLGTVSLFILLGEVLFRSGTVDVLIDSLDKMIGRIRGRHYVLSVALATVLGALSGSAMAVGAMIGRSLLPVMLARQYDVRLSIGTILGGACLAPIIPPSILGIIVAMLANISVSSLLIAGIIPGVIIAVLFVGYALVRVRLNPALAPEITDHKPTERGELLAAIAGLLPFTLIIFMVIGLILLGIATPSEAAATGVLGSLITAAIYRRLSFRMLFEAFAEATILSAVILIIIASAVMFTQLLAFTGATGAVTRLVASLEVNQWVLLFMLLLLPFILCMFIDGLGLMLILIPIYLPIVDTVGWDPIWFWLIFLVTLTLGAITPPFGVVLFAVKGAAPDISMGAVFAASWPFVAITLCAIFILIVFPGLVTFLPGLQSP